QLLVLQHRGKFHPIGGRGHHRLSILWRDIIRMHEVGKGTIRDTCEEGTSALLMQLIPAHVRHFQAGHGGWQRIRETSYLTLKNAEPCGQPKLLTLREYSLQANTNSQ